MDNDIIPPCEELKDFISCFWEATWDSEITHNSTYFVTANSFTEVVFAFQKRTVKHPQLIFSAVQGHTSKQDQLPSGGIYEMFGVSIHSYAIPFLFHIPANQINNEFLTLEILFGTEGKFLIERIEMAHNTKERIQILSDFFKLQLSKQRHRDLLIPQVAQFIRSQNGNVNIEDLSNKFCLSQKQLERRFKANAGFTPKLYSRIVRFENTIYNHSKYSNLTEAAYMNGYSDQAHFIRDFKTFTGYSPKKFLELSGY